MTEVKHSRSLAHIHIEEVTLVAGAASFENPFAGGEVLAVNITQVGAAAVAASYAADWTTNPNLIAIDSSDGADVSKVRAVVHGRY